jgi:hypothetical protein
MDVFIATNGLELSELLERKFARPSDHEIRELLPGGRERRGSALGLGVAALASAGLSFQQFVENECTRADEGVQDPPGAALAHDPAEITRGPSPD